MKRIVLVFFFILVFSQTAYATDISSELYDEFGIDSVLSCVPDDVQDMLRDYDLLTVRGLKEVLHKIYNLMIYTIRSQVEIIWKPAVRTVYIIVLCSVFSIIFAQKKYDYAIMLVGSVMILTINIGDTRSYFADSVRTVQAMYDFSTVLLPCLSAASIFAGGTISAGLKYTAAALFMNLILNFCNTVLVPMLSFYLICLIGDSVFGQSIFGGISDFIQWGCRTVLKGAVVLFVSYLTISGMIAGAGEVLAVKIAKTSLSNGLPIVGRIISDTASTLISGASLLRNGVGVFGMLAIVCMLIIPLTSLGIRYFLFKTISKIAELFTEKRFAHLIAGISEVYGMLFAIIGTGFVMLFLSIVSFMQVSGVT